MSESEALAEKYDYGFGTNSDFHSINDLLSLFELGCDDEDLKVFRSELRWILKKNRNTPLEDVVSWYGVVELAYSLEKIGRVENKVSEGFGERIEEMVFGEVR